MLIWAGPGTPLIPILIVVALGIAKMIRKPKLAGRYALIIALSMVIASGPITIDIVQENYNSQEGGLYDQRAIKHITEETYISMA